MQLPSYVALSQQTALQRQVEVIANNLANISTPAFKSDRLIFSEFVQSAGDPADPTATMSFVREVGSVRDLRDGAIAPTGNTFDFAIQGPGYFAVQAPGGTRYTRNGTFHLDGQGRVVTVDNFPVLDSSNSPITMRTGESRFEVTAEGQISTDSGTLARIQIATFTDEQSMKKAGAGLYETEETPRPADPKQTSLRQGMIEGSNVQSILEVTSLIEVSRRYQMAQNVMSSENDLQTKAIQQLGRVA